MESSFTLFKVRGIPIGVSWSWLLIFGLIVWSLSEALFPATYPGFAGTTYVIMAFVAASLFFASVLLHELGHALRAQREGMPIRGITLWLFGGVAHLSGSPPSPGAEFRVAILGPVVSLALAMAFLGGAWVGDSVGWPGTVQGVVDYLGRINLLVLGFNLVPALPLDGGRVLRSWLWRRQRSFTAATRSAAAAGRAFGWMLIAIGVAGMFGGGSGFGGLWLAVIGWFLISAARAEADQALIRRALGDLRVRDLMEPSPQPAGTGDAHLAGEPRAAPPLPPPSGEAGAATLAPDQPAYDVVGTLAEEQGAVAVLEGGREVGVLRIEQVEAALRRGLAEGGDDRSARRAGVLVWIVVGLIILVAGAALYRPPYVVIGPGEAIEVSDDIRIEGVPVDDLSGRYLITTVLLSRTNALGTLWAALSEDRDVVSVDDLYPPGVEREEYSAIQRRVFVESRNVAAAAAARAAGLPVTLDGSGAAVVQVVEGSPAEGVLQPGDAVVQVEGEPVGTAAGLIEAVRSRPLGTELNLAIERAGRRREVTVRSEELPDVAGRPGIGILVETRGLEIELPFEITFEERDIGGPSAGLAYALAVADLLTETDLAGGRVVAATGTISLDGEVGPVGGVEQKAVAVSEAGADLFLVPQGEVGRAAGEGGAAIRNRAGETLVRGVDDLEEALAFLRLGA